MRPPDRLLRTTRLALGVLCLLLGLGAPLDARAAPTDSETPPERIVLIVVDTLRRDHLSCYGGPVATPNIDRLAARGQRFEQAFSSFHMTSMSMGSLFTGRTPSIETAGSNTSPFNGRTWCGLARFATDSDSPQCIPENLPTLATRLRDAGYWTMGVGSNPFFFGDSGFSRGFDDWSEVKKPPRLRKGKMGRDMGIAMGRSGMLVNRNAIEALERRPKDRFFLYLHYMDSHDYAWREMPYATGVSVTDAAVGLLLKVLEREGLVDDTVILLTADHGERLEETHPLPARPSHMGNPSFDYLIQVPLIVAPAVGGDPTRVMRSDDVHRLVLEIAGIEEKPPMDLEPGELFLTELLWRTYRKGRWKSMWPKSGDPAWLFDMNEDPGETRNVAGQHPEILDQHRARIEDLRKSLAAHSTGTLAISDDDRARLEALGYTELAEPLSDNHTH